MDKTKLYHLVKTEKQQRYQIIQTSHFAFKASISDSSFSLIGISNILSSNNNNNIYAYFRKTWRTQ
jgi:hypothetical protein